jgi:hypothetical protein
LAPANEQSGGKTSVGVRAINRAAIAVRNPGTTLPRSRSYLSAPNTAACARSWVLPGPSAPRPPNWLAAHPTWPAAGRQRTGSYL